MSRLAVPPGVVTDTDFGPIVPEGVVAVTTVELATVTAVAGVPPIVTEVTPARFVPEIVIEVPPTVGPEFGMTLEMLGAGAM